MDEARRAPVIRLVLAAALLSLGVAEVLSMRTSLVGSTRLRDRALRDAREAMRMVEQPMAEALRPGGRGAWSNAARQAVDIGLAREAEVFDTEGRFLVAWPERTGIAHWPSDADALAGDRPLAVGPVVGRAARVLVYRVFPSGGTRVVLRAAVEAPDLVEDLRERRWSFVFQGLALVALLVGAVAALTPPRGEEAGAPTALHAYEEAMTRLRSRGDAITRQQDARVRALEERVQDREALARAGELTAGMVHEVRNGLGTIVGWARIAERTPEQAAEAARLILEECETLEAVVRRFMEFVKRESLNVSPVDVARLLARVAAREGRARPIAALTVDAEGSGSILADEDLLERAMENVVRNALEAAGADGHVTLRARRQGDLLVEMSVDDDGPGFPPEAEGGRAFFTTKAGGLGLGLPLAIKLVGLHGGRLALLPRTPRGTTASVIVPVTASSDEIATVGNDSEA